MVVDILKYNEKLNLLLQTEQIHVPCLLLNGKVDELLAGIDNHQQHNLAT
jgi:hypothetical protein